MTGPAPIAPAARAASCARDIAFYLPSLAGGGAERVTLMLITELRARGARVSLLLGNASGPLMGDVPAGCEVVSFGTSRTARDLPHLLRFLRRRQPDILVAAMNHNNIAALLAKSLARAPTRLVITFHNALSMETGAGAPRGYRVLPLCYRALAGAADAIVAVSAGVADDMAATTGVRRDRVSVLHNPVIDSGFAARAATLVTHPWLRARAETTVFVTAGRLTRQKDHATLLHAMALRLHHGPARLIILGEGPERAALEHLAEALGIAPHVAFPGFVANPLPYIRAASAFVLSSRWEGFGNVLVEALGCGTPVISTDCPHGPAEILADGAFGMLVPVSDPGALAAAMASDARARFPAPRLRARAETFGSARVADGYIALFETVLAR